MEAERFGNYLLQGVVGTGATGPVWRAVDPETGQWVVIKTLGAGMRDHPNAAGIIERLRRELAALRLLNHPGIIALHDSKEEQGVPYLVLELVQGRPLADILRQERFSQEQSLELLGQLLDSLTIIHQQGVVHCDLKPANLILTPEGRLKLVDFGNAQSPAWPANATGTPGYVAPEQRMGQPVDGRADLFAAGAILYQLVTGSPPFVGTNSNSTLHAALHATPIWPMSPLTPVLRRALAKRPSERFQNATQFLGALRRHG